MKMKVLELADDSVLVGWEPVPGAESYRVYWADRNTESMVYKRVAETGACQYRLNKATHLPHYFYVEAVSQNGVIGKSEILKTPVRKVFRPQLEKLNRGLIAVPQRDGVFLSWRLFRDEADGYCDTGLTGADFAVYRDGRPIARVTESTNYLDWNGHPDAEYQVAPVRNGREGEKCAPVRPWEKPYLEMK